MKLGILTFTEGQNIGQRLQNYALQEVLKDRGHDVYTIRQKKPLIKTIFRRKKIDKGVDIKQENKSKVVFKKFDEKHIQFYMETLSFFQNYIELKGMRFPYHGNGKKIDKFFDGFIVGSDQVWNPESPDVSENYFLTFTSKEKRYVYAPSFSVDCIPEGKKKQYRHYLEGFSYITIREEKGAKIIYDLTGRNSTVVLDPTLLLDKKRYDCIRNECKNKPTGDYILILFLGKTPQKEINFISSQLGVPVFSIEKPIIIPPDEFLDVVANARLILTDSYHVTIFSIIYHRPFVNFTRSNGQSMNSRFDTLYYMTGITGRMWNEKMYMEEMFLMDYETIDSIICKNKKSSLSTLEIQGI